jgi:hypothetical protein
MGEHCESLGRGVGFVELIISSQSPRPGVESQVRSGRQTCISQFDTLWGCSHQLGS